MTRREFIGGLTASVVAVAGTEALAGKKEARGLDPNLAVFFSDIHCHEHTSGWVKHQHAILQRYVSEILAMRVLPANAVVFGDFSASVGWEEDFRKAREILQPLINKGVKFTFGMGNHDKRGNFLKVFPEYKERLLVENRIVSKFSTPNADFIMLDSLREREGDADNYVDGRIDGEQREWLKRELASAKRPLFLGAHHNPRECGIANEVVRSSKVFGFIFGHDHIWADGYLHDGTYQNSQTVQMATLPSGGFYGDLGYALFQTFKDRAELTLKQDDFFFNRDWKEPRPKNWQQRVKSHKNAKIVFWYEKARNFYGG